jgi:hypothetical protein
MRMEDWQPKTMRMEDWQDREAGPVFCVDDHHDTPCQIPCYACLDDCSGDVVNRDDASLLYPDWNPFGDEENV